MDGSTAEQRRPVIVITGAAGYTGMHACRHFAKLGWEVAALTRTADSVPELILLAHDDENSSPEAETRSCITPYVCDLLDKKRLGEVIRQIAPDYVLHLGGKNSVPESWQSPCYTWNPMYCPLCICSMYCDLSPKPELLWRVLG